MWDALLAAAHELAALQHNISRLVALQLAAVVQQGRNNHSLRLRVQE